MRYLLLLLGLISTAYGQFAPTSAKTAFKNGISIGTRDSTAYTANDSLVVVINRQGRMMYRSTDGYWKILSNAAASDYVPYTGAVTNVNLGNFRLTARSLRTDSIYSNSSAGMYLLTNSGNAVAHWGGGGSIEVDFKGFAGYDANRSASYTARSFTDKGYVDSADALRVKYTDTAAMLSNYRRKTTLIENADLRNSAITINGSSTALGGSVSVGTVTSVAASAGTGISVSGSPITGSGTLTITNTAPDQTVTLTAGSGISVSGTYPNFTITNSSPSSGGTVTSVSAGTGMNFTTITSTGAVNADTTVLATRAYAAGLDVAKANTSLNNVNGVLSSTYGGAGSVSGILKANGSGVVSAAVAGTDYVAPSALSGYLPLTGGTLTGALSGTSLSMSGGGSFNATSAVSGYALDVRGATNKRFGVSNSNSLSGASVLFYTDGNAFADGYIDGSNLFLNSQSTGSVLINTTTTDGTNKLIVNGGAKFVGEINLNVPASGGTSLNIDNRAAENGSLVFRESGNRAVVQYISPTFSTAARQNSLELGTISAGSFIAFRPVDTERMRITSTGALIVGNAGSIDAGGASSGDIAVGPSARKIGYIPSSSSNRGYFEPYDDNGFVNIVSTFATAGITFKTGQSATERMRITSAGNVGIGTSSPSQRLTIGATNGYPIIDFYNSGTGFGDIGYNAGTSTFNLSSYSTTPLAIYTNGSERMRITSAGRLLLNTTTDNGTDALQVNGSGRFASSVGIASAVENSVRFVVAAPGTTSAEYIMIGRNSSGNFRYGLDATGAATFAGSVTATDYRGSTASYSSAGTISANITTAFLTGNAYTINMPTATNGKVLIIIAETGLNTNGITLNGVNGGTYLLSCHHSLVLVGNGTTWKIASDYQNSAPCS